MEKKSNQKEKGKSKREEYGRWGRIGVKVISKPEPKPEKKGR